jgi:hypothetical protein
MFKPIPAYPKTWKHNPVVLHYFKNIRALAKIMDIQLVFMMPAELKFIILALLAMWKDDCNG